MKTINVYRLNELSGDSKARAIDVCRPKVDGYVRKTIGETKRAALKWFGSLTRTMIDYSTVTGDDGTDKYKYDGLVGMYGFEDRDYNGNLFTAVHLIYEKYDKEPEHSHEEKVLMYHLSVYLGYYRNDERYKAMGVTMKSLLDAAYREFFDDWNHDIKISTNDSMVEYHIMKNSDIWFFEDGSIYSVDDSELIY